MGWRLYCARCGFEGGSEEYYPYCPRCGGPLDVRGSLPRLEPVMGEGGTPLVEREGVLFKLEYLNPSGSFKDRGVAYSVGMAARLGYRCVVVDSSGNTGVSTAAYSSFAGLEAIVVVPEGASKGKKALIRALGARLIEAPTREDAGSLARRLSSECFYIAHTTSPIFIEGVKSIASEISGVAWGSDLYLPVSSGTLLLGVHRGLSEAGAAGYRLIAVQASEAQSLRGRVRLLASVGGPKSALLDALVIKDPPRIREISEAVNSTGGGLVVVGDGAIPRAMRKLYSAGFIVEPSSASVWAALESWRGGGRPLLILTGSGMKYAGTDTLKRLMEGNY